jgi:hypothetical protein
MKMVILRHFDLRRFFVLNVRLKSYHYAGLPHQNWAEKNPGTVAVVDGYKPSVSWLPSDECFHVKSPTI